MIGSVDGLIDYAQDRGQGPLVAKPVDDLRHALVRASDYIRFHYILRFRDPFTEESPFVDAAAYEAAMIEIESPGFFSKTYTDGERKVLTEVKGIKWTLLPGNEGKPVPVSTLIEAMMTSYLRIRMSGAFVV